MKPTQIQINDKLTVRINDIVRLKGWENYTHVWVVGQPTPHLAARTLLVFEKALPKFWRVHRSHLVNPAYVTGTLTEGGNLMLKDGTLIPVSRRRKQVVIRALQIRTHKTDN